VVIGLCAISWLLIYFLTPRLQAPAGSAPASFLWEGLSGYLPAWANTLASFLVYGAIGYFLVGLNNRFGIIRTRATMQTGVYFLLVAVCPAMHQLYDGAAVAMAFLVAIYFLFGSYQRSRPMVSLFYAFFAIGVGSLFFPPFTLLFVLWILEAYRFQSLTWRSFFAAVVGWALPYWFLLAHAVYHGRMELFYQPFRQIVELGKPFDLSLLTSWQWAILGYLFVFSVISTAHSVASGLDDNIRTRAYLRSLIDQTFFLFFVILLQPMYCDNLLPQLMVCGSVLIAHFFMLTGSRTSNVLFILSLLGLAVLLAFNTWTLL
jgi:hypothetical protein